MKPHETLLDDGILVQFEDEMGRAAFVSHQWISPWNPDPNLSQLRHLQGALMKITKSSKAHIDPDILTELSGHAYQPGMSVHEFRSKPLFIWYDYFSIPQISAFTWTLGDINKPIDDAIASMPAYIARSHFFLVLCPVVESPDQTELFGPATWASRGWCRVEKTFRQLLPQRSYVVIKSADHFEMINDPATSYVLAGCPGEGMFGFKEDKERIGKTLGIFLKHLVLHYLQKEDFVAYRTYLNMQAFYLRGFSTGFGDEMFHLVPGSSELSSHLSPTTASFLYQNGFKKIREYDRSGWSPLCYAALRGDPEILQSLLKDKANPDEQTKKTNHLIGLAPALSVLALSSFFGHKECVQVLISARANLAAGYNPPLLAAAMGNQPECIRMLCNAGDSPCRTAFGSVTPLLLASMVASTEAVMEVLSLMGPRRNLSRALIVAMWYRGGTAELVQQLVEARADVNEQVRWPRTEVLGAAWAFQTIQYQLGAHRIATRLAYHSFDATPLMFAIISGQYEGASALLVAKADVSLQNSRKKTALELAQEMQVPQFLMDGLEGDLSTCNRIVASALTNRYPVSISF